METKILQSNSLHVAVEALRQGEVVVFPTETVYGLGACVEDEQAVQAVYEIKQRPKDNPLIIHTAHQNQAFALFEEVYPEFIRLAEVFWPGPLTLIGPRKQGVAHGISASQSTIACRVPSHPIALALLRELNMPLVAPSANISGRPSPTNVEDVLEDLAGQVPFIVDGGSCDLGIESTVIGKVNGRIVLFRPGTLAISSIEEVLREKVVLCDPRYIHLSPGMRYRHYAPKARVRLVFPSETLTSDFVLSPHPKPGQHLLSAKTLYQLFRLADRKQVAIIDVECTEDVQKNVGLMNRLLRASEA